MEAGSYLKTRGFLKRLSKGYEQHMMRKIEERLSKGYERHMMRKIEDRNVQRIRQHVSSSLPEREDILYKDLIARAAQRNGFIVHFSPAENGNVQMDIHKMDPVKCPIESTAPTDITKYSLPSLQYPTTPPLYLPSKDIVKSVELNPKEDKKSLVGQIREMLHSTRDELRQEELKKSQENNDTTNMIHLIKQMFRINS